MGRKLNKDERDLILLTLSIIAIALATMLSN
jgi:hypothetical protein